MDIIPIDPTDENLGAMLESFGSFPFSFVRINHPGDYERENIVFRANEDSVSLSDYIIVYSIEDEETGLPVYSKCRLLTFDCIELEKGALVQIFTRFGEDMSTITFKNGALNQVLYWGLPETIWDKPHSSYELIRRTDSIGGGLLND